MIARAFENDKAYDRLDGAEDAKNGKAAVRSIFLSGLCGCAGLAAIDTNSSFVVKLVTTVSTVFHIVSPISDLFLYSS